jgi:phosphoribosylformimino-5-aminoimidazole carboxamide ribotide isomerase
MQVLPAIDLISGKCVRLIQGEYDKQITYKDDPVAQAKEFVDVGSDWVHIIDLEGAKIGKPVNTEALKAIIDADLGLKIELGGGIRDEEAIQQMLDIGVDRLIIGTRAINHFDWFTEMANKFPDKLALGLDARGSKVSVAGWTKDIQKTVLDFAEMAVGLPLAAIIYTDITKDGMLSGPNLERTKALVDAVELDVIAAGGVTSVEDITQLKAIGVSGAIIGRALYEGNIDLKDAIQASKQ